MYLQQPKSEYQPCQTLSLSGNNGYKIQDGRVVISISTIANNRSAGNVSGTLSIELWALNQAYDGGNFSGIPLAGTQIGEILDQHSLHDCCYDLIFNEPNAGTWYLTLMLREWEGNGFETRDYYNFSQPYVIARKQPAIHGKVENVISVNFPGKEGTSAEPAKAADVEVQQGQAEKISKDEHLSGTKISINRASVNDLASIKGLPMKTAKAIVEARPFTTIEDLLRIKGIGPKFLDKLRKLIQL